MEEIYKPTDPDKVELYHRENNDILGDIPNWLVHTGSYIVYGIVLFLLIGMAVFKYPNVVESSISIDDVSNVEWVTANHPGIIDRFFVEDMSAVQSGDTLGILRNSASFTDVKRFCRVLTNVEWYYRTNDASYLKKYPFNLILGEMSPAYEQFTQAVRTCLMQAEFNLYPQKAEYLKKELEILGNSEETHELSMLRVKRELFELEMEQKMEIAKNSRMLELAYENMVNSIKAWESKYMIRSQSAGTVVLGKSWGRSNTVGQGDTICSVVSSQEGHPAGHIRLSSYEVAEIVPGSKVNIELTKYPAHTYGYLVGEVESVSYIPHNKSYAVEVSLPEKLRTTNREEIGYEIGLSGKAEIITSNRSILERIFMPILKSLTPPPPKKMRKRKNGLHYSDP